MAALPSIHKTSEGKPFSAREKKSGQEEWERRKQPGNAKEWPRLRRVVSCVRLDG